MVILRFALKRSFRSPIPILISVIVPVALLAFSGLWGDDDSRGYYFIALIILFLSFPLTGAITSDRRERTIVRIMTTPTTTFKYLSQNFIACMVPLLIQITIIGALGMLWHDWHIEFAFNLCLIYAVFAATSIAFAFAWSCIFKSKEVSFTVLAMVMTFASFAGILLPLEFLPTVLYYIFMIFPTFWVASGIEELIFYGATGWFIICLTILVGFVVLFLMDGSRRGAY